MPVVVDPNAPDTFREKFVKAFNSTKVPLLNLVFVAALAYVAFGLAPEWASALLHTLVWLYVPLLVFVVGIFIVMWVIIAANKSDIIKASDDKARDLGKSMAKLDKQLKPKPITWFNHACTVAEVVFLYMIGWYVAGAFVLITSLIFLILKQSFRKEIKEITMAKLGRE